jgi:peptidoglycan/xylan/chitin deacetylase (PgdA/CDA1 family)
MNEIYFCIKEKKKIPRNSFAITFDDGFYNNFSIAAPILKKMKIPATFYITTDFIENNLTSWIDRIEIAVENTVSARSIKVNGIKLSFSNSIKSKINFLKKIRKILKNNSKYDLYNLSDQIIKEIGFRGFYKKSDSILDKKMNWQNIKDLMKNDLFAIGGHSSAHKIFSQMKYEECKDDIINSIKIINKRLKIKLRHYSYPEGLKKSYSEREIKILKSNGILICPSAVFGKNNQHSDLYHLKRIFCNK